MDDQIFLNALKQEQVEVSQPFGDDLDAYFLGDTMFAIWHKGKTPSRVSVRCDARLAKDLRERYESVLPGENLDPNKWNTLIITEQLGEQFVVDMIRHAYEIAKKESEQ